MRASKSIAKNKLLGVLTMQRAEMKAFGVSALLAVAIAENLWTQAQKRAAQPQTLSATDLLNASGMQASAAQQAALLGSGSGQLSAAWGDPSKSGLSESANHVAQSVAESMGQPWL
jgi:hypothetical protein